MSDASPIALAAKIKNIIDICEAADDAIAEQQLIKKGALDAGKENDGIEPAVVRTILSQRKKKAKNPAEAERIEELADHYRFLLGDANARPWTQADDEMSRVMALTNTDKPPKIDAIKKALGCSQGKAHKLRTIAAARLAAKSSRSLADDEHEHSPETADDTPPGEGEGTADPPDSPGSALANNRSVCPTAWHEITAAREEHEARKQAERDAARERRRAAERRIAEFNARVDADPLIPPAILVEKRREIEARKARA